MASKTSLNARTLLLVQRIREFVSRKARKQVETNEVITALQEPSLAQFHLPPDHFSNPETSMEGCNFTGKVHVVGSLADEKLLVQDRSLLDDFDNQRALGMDIEYENLKGRLPAVALIQIASHQNAILWRFRRSEDHQLPPYLVSLLHGDALKVGHCLWADAIFLHEQYGHVLSNIVDTLNWAKEMNCSPLNLRAVVAIFLNERLSKKAQQSDWTKGNLSVSQLNYAATDAWASLRVYQEMKRVAKENSMPLSPPLESTLDVLKMKVEARKNRRRRKKARKREVLESNNESVP